MKYIKDIKTAQGSIKVLTDVLIMEDKNMPVIINLNFDYYVKDSIPLLGLLLGQMPDNQFTSQYGNHDIFKYDTEKNILTKEYNLFKKGKKDPIPTKVSFNLTEELKNELIDFIKGKYNDYVEETARKANAKANKTKLSNKLENTKSNNKRGSDIQQQESPVKMVDTEIKSQKELKDFNTFKDVMEMDTYLRTNANGTAFIKWLQDKKIITQSQSYAVGDLVHNKSIIELNRLREEYLK